MSLFAKIFRSKAKPIQDISAREADLLSSASNLISGEPEEFLLFWKDISQIIRNKTEMSSLRRVEINLSKYYSLIRKFKLTDVLTDNVPEHLVIDHKYANICPSLPEVTKLSGQIFNHSWLENFICTKIKERGFKTEIHYIKMSETIYEYYPRIEQVLVIEW